MQREIMDELAKAGLHARAVSIAHLRELRDEFVALRRDGILGDEIMGYLDGFRMDDGLHAGMRTILVVATPSWIGQAVFHGEGGRLTALIPPTYLDYGRVPANVEAKLNVVLAKYGHRAQSMQQLPAKMLAARSGLAQYGRNNVCYVKGLGSFALLSTYLTDMPCEEDGWQQPRRMERCERCAACAASCPTDAIRMDRAVIDAARCLTLHNEADSSIPFPGWINPSAHNSLVGCLRCQAVCPENGEFLSLLAAPVEFDKAETAGILAGKPSGELPADTLEKMKRLNMDQYYDPVARNLQALYSSASCTGSPASADSRQE